MRLHGLKMWLRALALLCLLQAGMASAAEPEQLLVISYHDVRDDVAKKGDTDSYAISTQNFAAHLDWLSAQGYHPISLSQLIDASEGRATLPAKPVLLTFDDGLRSLYTKVFPLLRAYRFPALAAVITGWVDLPQGQTVDFGPRPYTHDDFVTWAQLREMQDSGLVEIASHTDNLHRGVLANPQGNQTPAVITRLYDATRGTYESEAAYRERVRADLARSSQRIERHLGRKPRSIVWPYAAYNRVVNDIADGLGMRVTFDLEGRNAKPGRDLHGLARLLMLDNPTVADLAYDLRRNVELESVRALQIDLDAVYDADPVQQSRNIDTLIERVKQIGPSHVFLQAFADPDGNGSADALYFPNRFLPMRADLFNRVAWQLHTRAEVVIYAWLPVLGYELPDPAQRNALAIAGAQGHEIFRLDFTKPEARKLIAGIYDDLAVASYFEGLLFHDDAFLREGELGGLSPNEPAARTQALIDFTLELKNAAEKWRPKLKTVRNLYANTVIDPASEAWFAQRLDSFNRAYDYTALMAMPWMEGSREPRRWMRGLVAEVRRHDPGFNKTMFELQTVDWRSGKPIPGDTLKRQTRELQAAGVRHLAWYPYDFIADSPSVEVAREAISARNFPYIAK